VHERAFAFIQARALNAIQRGDGEVYLLAAGTLRIDRKLGQTTHVAHVMRGETQRSAPKCLVHRRFWPDDTSSKGALTAC